MYLQEVNFQDTNLQNKKVFNNFRIRSAMSSLRRLFLAQISYDRYSQVSSKNYEYFFILN